MVELISLESFFTLLMLIMLQAVLGFDNLLYIAIESNKVAPENAQKVRRWGIGLAMVFRIVLLIVIVKLFAVMQGELFHFPFEGILEGRFTLQALVTLLGGAFIIYTAVREISHMLTVDHIEHSEGTGRNTLTKAIALIVVMNLVFSFDSILSAMAIASIKDASGVTTGYQMEVMVIAILLSSLAMMLMADYVTEFLKKNRMYEVMGLFILFLVGVLLVTEGAHLAHLTIFTFPIEAMSKSSFYLVVGVLVITDVISSKYQKRLWAQKEAEIRGSAEMAGAEAVNEFKKTH
jgi:predicted tellurium resistance membrane protein TerC